MSTQHFAADGSIIEISGPDQHRSLRPRDQVLHDIDAERQRQDAKWGEQNHPDGTGPSTTPIAIYNHASHAAELARRAKHTTDHAAEAGHVTWRYILLEEVFEALAESDVERLRTELVQVAAVAAQWAEAIDRRGAEAGAR